MGIPQEKSLLEWPKKPYMAAITTFYTQTHNEETTQNQVRTGTADRRGEEQGGEISWVGGCGTGCTYVFLSDALSCRVVCLTTPNAL